MIKLGGVFMKNKSFTKKSIFITLVCLIVCVAITIVSMIFASNLNDDTKGSKDTSVGSNTDNKISNKNEKSPDKKAVIFEYILQITQLTGLLKNMHKRIGILITTLILLIIVFCIVLRMY